MVGIIMGSDSDLKIMSQAAEILESFEIEFEVEIFSAHRTPNYLNEYAKKVREESFDVVIAGAGGAAHLPGVLAALVDIPVIGVPILTTALGGLDSLYSIVQMPSGIPVATVGINAALNAGVLAAKILAIKNLDLKLKVSAYSKKLENSVLAKNERIKKIGYKAYMEEQK